MGIFFEQNAVSALEKEIRRLEQERDAAISQVKKLQAALRQKKDEVHSESSEQEEVGGARLILESILENAPDGLAICDLSGRITYCSQEGMMMSDMFPEEMPGSTPEKRRRGMSLYKPDGTTPADLDELPLVQVLRTGKPVRNRELLIRHRDGKEIPIRSNAAPIRDREGNLIGAIHVWRDVSEQKRTEKALRESHKKFRTLFESTPVLTTVSTVKEGRILDVNRAFEKVTGHTRDEAIGKTSYELNIWRRREARDRFEEILLNNAPLRDEEAEIATKFGEKRTVLISAETIELAGEKCVITSAQDITLRKQSEERLQMALEVSQMGVWELNLGDKSATRTLEHDRIFGYEDLLPKWTYETFLEHVLPEDREKVDKKFKRAIATGRPWHFECRIRRSDNRLRWIEAQGQNYLDETEETRRMVGLVADITSRKRGEEAVRESEEKFRAVFEQAAVGIGRVSFDNARWIDVNEAFCSMLGYSSEEMYATPWPNITHPDDLDLDLIPFRRMAAGELDSYSLEKRFIHKEGHHVWARLTLSLVRDPQGQPDYEVAVIENITERKHAEEQLKEAKTAAEEASRAKSEFLANMSHEIRTPMTVFLIALARLQGMDQIPKHRQLLEMADRAGKRLRALIDDILDFSQIEARHVLLEPEPFHLRPCVDNAVELLHLSAQEKGIALTVDVDPEVPEKIVADHDRLSQVLVNFVANAVKFTEQGEVKVSVRTHDDHLDFAVKDTGPGIAKEKQTVLFRSFSQVDATRTRRQQGSGLGLAISKALVELMRGEIHLESRPGEGSTFSFTLPLQQAAPSQDVSIETVEEASAEKEKKNLRILVAEDESTIRDLMGMILRQKGHLVEMATDGQEAVDKRRNQDYDLVLMDMHMPELDGMEAACAIRNLEQKHNLKPVRIIALTADVRKEVKEQCRAAGMDSFISKPLKMEELFSEIEK